MATPRERKLAGNGLRFALSGIPLVVVGVVLALALSGTAIGIGVAIAVFGAILVTVGVVLAISSGVEQRSREQKPFA
jgi:uncharacterized membrane protein YccF (DUF307 family)